MSKEFSSEKVERVKEFLEEKERKYYFLSDNAKTYRQKVVGEVLTFLKKEVTQNEDQ